MCTRVVDVVQSQCIYVFFFCVLTILCFSYHSYTLNVIFFLSFLSYIRVPFFWREKLKYCIFFLMGWLLSCSMCAFFLYALIWGDLQMFDFYYRMIMKTTTTDNKFSFKMNRISKKKYLFTDLKVKVLVNPGKEK
jgi:hypothetical protein